MLNSYYKNREFFKKEIELPVKEESLPKVMFMIAVGIVVLLGLAVVFKGH